MMVEGELQSGKEVTRGTAKVTPPPLAYCLSVTLTLSVFVPWQLNNTAILFFRVGEWKREREKGTR